MKVPRSSTALVWRLVTDLSCIAACTVASAQATQEGFEAGSNEQTRLTLARRLIRETPCPGDFHNPLAVVRSVNCLHSLGKKKAISLLCEIASSDEAPTVVDPEDAAVDVRVLNGHDQRVCTIVPLLFAVPKEGTPPPNPWYCKRTQSWRSAAGPQVIQGGIPFSITGVWTYGGRPYPTRPLVEWAAKHGQLRAKRLHPQDDPLRAADALYQRITEGLVVEFENWFDHVVGPGRDKFIEDLEKDLRAQAIRMLPNGMLDLKVVTWSELKAQLSSIGLRWDPEHQVYVSDDDRSNR